MKNLLIIDNYDSFVYNIPQVLSQDNDIQVDVVRNNQLKDSHLSVSKYSHIIVSPGPGNPTNRSDFGSCSEIIDFYTGQVPILGICLGHQGIAAHFGAQIMTAKRIMHGHTTDIEVLEDCPLFQGIQSNTVMRYHSLVVESGTLPKEFKVTAVTNDKHKEIMAFNDIDRQLYAVQFHPESVATVSGKNMLNSFIQIN
jgi:anthranilate synthase/aminodeoxychorismate synthase-like glutamine amidotransferase